MQQREEQEQMAIFLWAAYMQAQYPVLRYMYHVPNGGQRNKATAGRLKAAGVKAGVPDICLPTPLHGYAGLYIELKYGRNTPSKAQREWLDYLKAAGYCVAVCYGRDEAIAVIMRYLQGGFVMLYELLTINCGVETVNIATTDKKAMCQVYQRTGGRDCLRVRVDGRLLTIREADKFCGVSKDAAPKPYKPKPSSPPKPRTRPVEVLDNTGTVIGRYDSLRDAAAACGVSYYIVAEHVRGKSKTSRCGLKFRLADG